MPIDAGYVLVARRVGGTGTTEAHLVVAAAFGHKNGRGQPVGGKRRTKVVGYERIDLGRGPESAVVVEAFVWLILEGDRGESDIFFSFQTLDVVSKPGCVRRIV